MDGREFGLGSGSRYRRDNLRPLAAPSKSRQHVERRPGRAEAAQHRKKADRANRLGATQPQPIETLLRIEFAGGQELASDLSQGNPAFRACDEAADIGMVPNDN